MMSMSSARYSSRNDSRRAIEGMEKRASCRSAMAQLLQGRGGDAQKRASPVPLGTFKY